MNDAVPQEARPANPFNEQAQSGGMQIPDSPLPDGTSAMLRMLLDNESTPEAIRRDFHFVHSRDIVLSFLDPERKTQKLLAYDILKLQNLMNVPWYNYTHEMEFNWAMERFELDVKLDRALGSTTGRQINERTVQQSQFQESRQVMNDETQARPSQGIFGRMVNFVGRK